MVAPYATTRTGSRQWIMQRVSAVLLVGLAFWHFAVQHFTSDAVSTGLTVAARFNDPYWQAYYVCFIVLALYHGVNGVVGILRDYNPRPFLRLVCEIVLWSLAAFWGTRGIINATSPRPLDEVKELYARNGFPAGDSLGSPPGLAGTKHYDFSAELRELHLLAYYLERHTHRTESAPRSLSAIFTNASPDWPGDKFGASLTETQLSGLAFDQWADDQVRHGPPAAGLRDPEALFSSTYEFAVWAARVRRANSDRRDPGTHSATLPAGVDPTAALASPPPPCTEHP